MVKILIGLVAAIVIAAGGFFGFQFYMQHRIASEIEAAFEQIRAARRQGEPRQGVVRPAEPHASRSPTSRLNRPRSRRSASRSPASRPRASVSRMRRDSPPRASKSPISRSAPAMAARPGVNLTYKAPRITVKNYSGPASLQRPPASASVIDIYRFALEQFAARHGVVDHGSQPCRDHQLRRRDAGRRRVHLFGPRDAGHQGRQDRHA